MSSETLPRPTFTLPDGSELDLWFCRLDERQRRQRLRLAKAANCWDYAPLVDVVRREPGFDDHRFTGKTAAQWLVELRERRAAPEVDRFSRWYEATVNSVLHALAVHPRVPDNHYCIELGTPPLRSCLPDLIRSLGLKRAGVEQWSASLRSLTGKGVKPEELQGCGVLTRLAHLPADATPTQAQVLQMVDLAHVLPKLACESRSGFSSSAGWHEGCQRIPEREFKRRGLLLGIGRGARHVIRFRHNSLGWSIVRTRYTDLVTPRSDWWTVLNEKGQFVQQPEYGFGSPEDAIAYAELKISQHFAIWGRDHALSKWKRFSLPGGDDYREILIQLDDWPGDYEPRHYRTRNVLVHLRTSLRRTQDGQRVLYLDEVQSDWHADLHAQAKSPTQPVRDVAVSQAPFRKEWPLLSMKLMLWWAQRIGAQGVAWSTDELQQSRWRGHAPPEALYRTTLPDAALSLATTLKLSLGTTHLSVRTNSRRVELGDKGWLVNNRQGTPITKPFRHRRQAEMLADRTAAFVVIEIPVLWVKGLLPIRSIPLYGVANAETWLQSTGKPADARPVAAGHKRRKALDVQPIA